VQQITPASVLPAISDTVTIDGTTQPGFRGTPLIVLNGAASGQATFHGLKITAANCVIRSLVVNRSNEGIIIQGTGATGNGLAGNYIGTDSTGTVAEPNGRRGVLIIDGAANNIIGGTTPADRNVIAANGVINSFYSGILLSSGATGNIVEGNYIGLGADGTTPLGNAQSGVNIGNLATNNLIGGTAPGAGNVLAANGTNGVAIDDYDYDTNTYTGTGGSGNKVQ